MQHTYTSQVKAKLEDAGISFQKVDNLRWVSYLDGSEVVHARTLGQCVNDTAQEVGE